MPLDTQAHANGLSHAFSGFPETLAELRLQLIGNRELKIRVLQEPQFVAWLLKQLQADLDTLDGEPRLPGPGLAADIHGKVVILRILACFIADVQNSDETAAVDPGALHGAVELMSRLFKYMVEVFLPSCGRNPSRNSPDVVEVKNDFQSLIGDALWIVLVLANSTGTVLDDSCYANLWKLTTALLICDDTKTPQMSSRIRTVVVSSLGTVPFLLKGSSRDLTDTYASPLLRLCLLRLYKEFVSLHHHYVDGLPTKGHFLEKVSPNIIADKRLFKESFELDFISSMVVVAAQLLNYSKERNKPLPLQSPFFNSREVFLCMVLLLKSEGCHLLNIGSLNLIHFYLSALEDKAGASEAIVFKTYERLFPRIIELLETRTPAKQSIPPFLSLPVSVLSALCLKYPRMSLHLHNTNVDMKIMKDLQELIRSTPLFTNLFKLKVGAKEDNTLADFTSLLKHKGEPKTETGLESTQIEQISDYLQLLSVYTSSNDEYRRRVTKFSESKGSKSQSANFLCLTIFELVDSYRFLINQFLLSYELLGKVLSGSPSQKVLTWFGKNLGVLYTLIEFPIFTQTIYLVRSLSRSLSTLRTFFVDCNSIRSVFDVDDDTALTEGTGQPEDIIEIVKARFNREISFKRRGSFISSLLDILSSLDSVKNAMQYFVSTNPALSVQYPPPRKTHCVKKVILLASIANFILDFSSFRYEIVNHDSFLVDLAKVFKGPDDFTNDEMYTAEEEKEITYERLREQLTVLQVMKSYLYNENEDHRKFLWEFVPLSKIFEKSLYGIVGPIEEDEELHQLLVQHKILAFEIMRNLTAASSFFSEAIRESYLLYVKEESNEAPSTWHEYLLKNLMSHNLFIQDGKIHDDEEFFRSDELLFSLVKNPDYVRLLVGINYVEDHRYTNVTTFKKSDFPSKAMVDIWKRILDAKLSDKLEHRLCGHSLNKKVKLADQLIELKFSIIWILINLTWQDDNYGYQVPDNVSFSLLDTVGRPHSDPRGEARQLFNSQNIVIEESEEDDDDEDDSHEHSTHRDEEDGEMSAEDKAKLLHRYQFSSILHRNIMEMSRPKTRPRSNSRGSRMERFDNLNANNLYEKSKTALSQITSLVSGHTISHDAGSQGGHSRTQDRHPLRRMSNIISSRDTPAVGRDVNRGGEGFGYDSADDIAEEGQEGATRAEDDEDEEEDGEEDEDVVYSENYSTDAEDWDPDSVEIWVT